MKQVIPELRAPTLAAPRRLSISEAKARLSEAIREAKEAPTVIHNRGRDAAVLISIDEYQSLVRAKGAGSGRSFLLAVDELKSRLGGGTALTAERARIRAIDPFAPRRAPRAK